MIFKLLIFNIIIKVQWDHLKLHNKILREKNPDLRYKNCQNIILLFYCVIINLMMDQYSIMIS